MSFVQRESYYSVAYKKYWCHICKNERSLRLEGTQTEEEQYCSNCQNVLEQIIPNQTHPKQYQIYRPPQPQPQRRMEFQIIFFTFGGDDHQQEGATQEQLQSLRREKNQQMDKSCYICQEDFREGEEMAVMRCNHGYHENCISTWLKMNNSCPVCRQRQQ